MHGQISKLAFPLQILKTRCCSIPTLKALSQVLQIKSAWCPSLARCNDIERDERAERGLPEKHLQKSTQREEGKITFTVLPTWTVSLIPY